MKYSIYGNVPTQRVPYSMITADINNCQKCANKHIFIQSTFKWWWERWAFDDIISATTCPNYLSCFPLQDESLPICNHECFYHVLLRKCLNRMKYAKHQLHNFHVLRTVNNHRETVVGAFCIITSQKRFKTMKGYIYSLRREE